MHNLVIDSGVFLRLVVASQLQDNVADYTHREGNQSGAPDTGSAESDEKLHHFTTGSETRTDAEAHKCKGDGQNAADHQDPTTFQRPPYRRPRD